MLFRSWSVVPLPSVAVAAGPTKRFFTTVCVQSDTRHALYASSSLQRETKETMLDTQTASVRGSALLLPGWRIQWEVFTNIGV